jgi:hypothetical protein
LKYPNTAAQQAAVRAALSKSYAIYRDIQMKSVEVDAFKQMVITKKKDLTSVIVNLKKQVEVMSLEQSLQH